MSPWTNSPYDGKDSFQVYVKMPVYTTQKQIFMMKFQIF